MSLTSGFNSNPQTNNPQSGFFGKVGNFVASAGKDAFNSTIGTYATRFGQLAGNIIAPMLGASKEGIQRANEQSVDLPLGLGTVEPQKGGMAGAKQIGGQALKTASYLIPGAEAEGVAGHGIGSGALEGLKIGAQAGALGGAGNSLEQGGNTSDVIGSGLKGGFEGAIAGGVIGGATGLAGNIWEQVHAPSYENNLAGATQSNLEAGDNAATSIQNASDIQAKAKSNLSKNFAEVPNVISQADPTAKTTLPSDFIKQLQDLSDTKKFVLPSSIKDASGNVFKDLTPQQTQELTTQLNRLTYQAKAFGDLSINQQSVDLANQLKNYAQSGLGHVTDNLGNSVWSKGYEDYARGSNAMDALSNLIPTKRVSGEMLDPTDVNSSVNKMMKMMETPQGVSTLARANEEYKAVTGLDILNDPMGAINHLLDSNKGLLGATKGSYMKQVVEAIKSPNMVARRGIWPLITGVIGIATIASAFKKQIGEALNSSGADHTLHEILHLP